MGSPKKLELPATPVKYTNSLQSGDMSYQSGLGHDLTSGNFDGNLSWLKPTMNVNNSANALSAAQGILQPQFRDNLQQITNSAAANNQLGSSTFTDALARSQSDINSQYQSIVSQQAINDTNQSNQNRLGLFGQGLNTLQAGIGNEQSDTNSTNSFNLANYENQVAMAIQNNKNANASNGWQQALGLASPIGHDYLQSQGIGNVPGYGVGDVAKIASMFVPGNGGGFGGGGGLGSQNFVANSGKSAPIPGFYASNGISSNPSTGLISYNPYATLR